MSNTKLKQITSEILYGSNQFLKLFYGMAWKKHTAEHVIKYPNQ